MILTRWVLVYILLLLRVYEFALTSGDTKTRMIPRGLYGFFVCPEDDIRGVAGVGGTEVFWVVNVLLVGLGIARLGVLGRFWADGTPCALRSYCCIC